MGTLRTPYAPLLAPRTISPSALQELNLLYEKKRNPSKICKKSQQAASGSKTRIPTSSSVTQDKCQCGRICKTVVASPTDTVNQNRTTFFTMERQPREKIKEGLRKIRHATGRRKSDGCACVWGLREIVG